MPVITSIARRRQGFRRLVALLAGLDPATAATVRLVLEAHRYRIVQADGPDDALQLNKAEQPDLALVQVDHPGFDGFALSKRLPDPSAFPGIFRIHVTATPDVPPGRSDGWLVASVPPALLRVQLLGLLKHRLTATELAVNRRLLAGMEHIARLGTWEFDPLDRKVIGSSEIFHLLGLHPTRKRLAFPAFLDVVHPDDRGRVSGLQQHAMTGAGAVDSEFRIVRADGGVRHVHGRAELIVDRTGGRRLAGTLQDVTERKAVEERLRRNEALAAIAGRAARFGGWEVDLVEGRVYWSDEVCAIHEMPVGSAPSLEDGINFYAPEFRDRIRQVFTRCATQGTPFDEELQLVTAHGRRIWVRALGQAVRDHDGAIVRVHGAFQDIDARKTDQLQIQRLADRLTTTLESITDAFFTLDAGWRFTYLNSQAERLLHRPRQALLGRVVWSEFPDAVGSRFEQEYRQAMASRTTAVFEAYYPPPLDTWYEVHAYPSEEGLAVYFRDINERRRMEAERTRFYAQLEAKVRERTAELERSNRELEAFSYSVSHDLRAPLRAIAGFGSLLESGHGEAIGPDGRAYLKRMTSAAARMATMIDGLLDLARVGQLEIVRQPVDLGLLAQGIVERLHEQHPGRQPEVTIDSGLVARGDPRLLERVIDNLLGNAWKFTRDRQPARIHVGARRGDGTVFFVADNGIGFDPAHAGQLFSTFQRLHAAQGFDGDGIGLAIAQRIIDRHGGRIWAEASPGEGATFCFELPETVP